MIVRTAPSEWNRHLLEEPIPQFLQSDAWAAFQASLGRQTLFLHDEIFSYQGMGVILPLGFFGSYLFFPRGPRVREAGDMARFFREARAACRERGLVFFRIEPVREAAAVPKLKRTTAIHPSQTLIIDLKKNEEALLAGMHPKTRYNIRLAEKKGVTVVDELSPARREDFIRLLARTSERQPFAAHPPDYYRALFEFFGQRGEGSIDLRLYSAMRHDICIASICVLSFGGVATYLHGASDYAARDLQAPSLLQWTALRDAKRRGASAYDLWGITASSDPHHSWAGITRFKRGFGGGEISYPGTFDSSCSPAYPLYTFTRRIARGR